MTNKIITTDPAYIYAEEVVDTTNRRVAASTLAVELVWYLWEQLADLGGTRHGGLRGLFMNQYTIYK